MCGRHVHRSLSDGGRLGSDRPRQALQFDGIADQIEVTSNRSLTLGNQLTFEAWINPRKQERNTILSSSSRLLPPTNCNCNFFQGPVDDIRVWN